MHHQVGIGAEHGEVPRPHRRQPIGIIVRRLGQVVAPGRCTAPARPRRCRCGAMSRPSSSGRSRVGADIIKWQRPAGWRAGPARPAPRRRMTDGVIAVRRHAIAGALGRDLGRQARRIGQQHHRAVVFRESASAPRRRRDAPCGRHGSRPRRRRSARHSRAASRTGRKSGGGSMASSGCAWALAVDVNAARYVPVQPRLACGPAGVSTAFRAE